LIAHSRSSLLNYKNLVKVKRIRFFEMGDTPEIKTENHGNVDKYENFSTSNIGTQ
jgi:hypothetical protein